MKGLYDENYNTLMKEIKDEINNGNTPHVHGLEDLRCQYYPKLSTYLYNPYQNPNDLFSRNTKTHPEFIQNSKGVTHTDVKTDYQYKAIIIKTVWHWHKSRI